MTPAALILTLALSTHQLWAYHFAARYQYPRTLQAIIYQESTLCRYKRSAIDHLSIGCGGLHLSTARMFDPKVTKDALLHDDARNIRDASAYLNYCMLHTDMWRRGVYAFHWGLPKARKATVQQINADPYVLTIVRKVK